MWQIEALRNALGICVVLGIVNCMMTERTIEEFRKGFILPFQWILVYSIFGLPLYFLGRKHPKAAKIMKRTGVGVFVLGLLLLLVITL